ncbi:MAG: alpha-(1-_3)-arabinofuranosyltransferase family protein [Actinomycetes bacterium]
MATALDSDAGAGRAGAGGGSDGPLHRSTRGVRALGYAVLALLAYVPVLRSDPGRVAADTKSYLTLDPSRVLGRGWSMWDPNIGLGTVTHQNIGYLFPMGPYYWLMEAVAVPDWVTQRLWLGSVLLAAGLGMLFLFRTLGVRGAGAVVGALAFMLSPYLLDYAARISVILLPWAGLPWMLAFVIRALRRGGWRYPALFALTVQIVGGVNATSLVFAGLAPLLWMPYAVWGSREVDVRRMLATVARVGVLTLLASTWWMAGLWAQGGYGIDILRFTETIRTVARTSTAPEVVRGLGYWFFYGQDKIGPWIEAALSYTQSLPHIAASFALPALALLAAGFTRWRHRAYFALLALVGATVAVGAYPFEDPSPFGSILKGFAESSTAGLALRSTGRATPLVVLSSSVFLAVGVSALVDRLDARGRRPLSFVAVGMVGVLVLFNLPALWNGTFYGKNLQRDETVPAYWRSAVADISAGDRTSRVLELPGADFASYRWGNTVDPITPGLTDRAYVARELIPYGSPPSADLLNAYDRRLQEGTYESQVTAPLMRYLGVGEIVVRNDLQTDRYNLVRPRQVWRDFAAPQGGLGAPRPHGSAIPGAPVYPQIDEQALAFPPGEGDPPPVAVVPVTRPGSLVRARSTEGTVLIAGDGDGLIDAAASGLVDGRQLVRYSASMTPAEIRAAVREGATLVVTDTNRRRGRRWSTVRDTMGATEAAGERPLVRDESDARLEVFPGTTDAAATVTEPRGVRRVQATAYGNPVTYTPEDRASRAIDGDVRTAWRVGAFSPVVGERLLVEAERAIRTDRVTLVQPVTGPRNRWISEVRLRFDGGGAVTRTLDDTSRTEAGQVLTFPVRRFRTLEIEVLADNVGRRFNYEGLSGVGLAEVGLVDAAPGAAPVRVDEVVRLPVDLLAAAGRGSAARDLVLVMTRERNTPVPPRTGDVEPWMARSFTLPTDRTFTVGGTARLSPVASGATTDRLLGASRVVATDSEHLAGDVRFRASSAIDGDPATAWNTPFVAPTGQWMEFVGPSPVSFDRLDLQVVADGRHSVPTRLTLAVDGSAIPLVVPPIADRRTENATTTVGIPLPRVVRGRTVRITVDEVREVRTRDFYGNGDVVMPAGIAELGVPGLSASGVAPGDPDARFTTPCREDLLTIDGTPVAISLVGTRGDATSRGGLQVFGCGATELAAGPHTLRAAAGAGTGIDIDRLDLRSLVSGSDALAARPAPGRAARLAGDRTDGPEVGPVPTVRVVDEGRDRSTVRVEGATPGVPFWLVLGQSHNRGWRASAAGRDLGGPTLVDGYANGWLVAPPSASFEVAMRWAPQRTVDVALLLSALAAVGCLALVVVDPRRRSVEPAVDDGVATLEMPGRSSVPLGAARSVGATLGVLGVGTLLAGPVVGGLAAVVTLAATRWPRARILLAIGPSVAVLLAGGYVTWRQWRVAVPPTFEWPLGFTRAHLLGWVAFILLAATGLLDLLDRRRDD